MNGNTELRYIVTGGAGFIGSNLVRALNERGETNILIVDRLGSGLKWRNLNGLEFEDFIDKDAFLETLPDIPWMGLEAVYHLGACSSTTEADADYLMRNNYAYTRQLCEACLRAGTRFVYASSAATYGDGSRGYSDRHESTPAYRPLNMYGYSKHRFDLWALRHEALDRVAGIKYFNVYGPGEAHKGDMRSMIHKAWGQVRERGEVRLFRSHRSEYADGEQVRDFVHVGDAVDLTLWLGDHPEINGLYNCGTGRARSWNDLARAVFESMGRKPHIRYIDMPESIRPNYQYYTEADLTKLREAGYRQAFTALEDGIRSYVRDHLESAGAE
ncbi:ADP-glyceromanno-heptose 6-epimerase [Kiritimatiella glycovorans]|uniref:ADP-L-glycero-D-manno-heptose-6-epimerase n=1 Tax=Kiritimatiella glycovorans TaxID=1307763 RepID=A0A0G3EHJ5_9BACT|nr:ADP-glyceromanno-heptose 6-epimerase [Kiritimatiella glycovorans]AKJ64882.1 ADP-L-glycero-D-manno-heptose-6-epimerase [Kiritimatiella glycovorans]